MCFKAAGSSLHCTRTSLGSLQKIGRKLAVTDKNSLAALEFGLKLQRKVIFPLLAGAMVTLLIGVIILGIMKIRQQTEKDPSPREVLRRMTNSALISSLVLGVTAAVSTMMTIGALKSAMKITDGPHIQQGNMLQRMELAGALLNMIFVVLALDLALESSAVLSMSEAELWPIRSVRVIADSTVVASSWSCFVNQLQLAEVFCESTPYTLASPCGIGFRHQLQKGNCQSLGWLD